MSIGLGSQIEIGMRMLWNSQVVMNVFQYDIPTFPGTVTPVQLAEAWWNHVKTTYRGMVSVSGGNVFQAVTIRELNNPAGDYAEFAVPIGEQPGTRPSGSLTHQMPSFTAAGVRLAVGTRATRPGQKRVAFLYEEDVTGNLLAAGIVTAINAWAAVIAANMTLGAPAALAVLDPIVVRKNAAGAVTASQPVVGFVTNPLVTTQVSRKQGRGI